MTRRFRHCTASVCACKPPLAWSAKSPDAITGELDIAVRTIDNVIADLRERIEGVNSGESGQPQGYIY